MPKKEVVRKCLVCGQRKDKKDLIRMVKDPQKGLQVDITGKMNGRGAYICKDKNCLAGLIKNRRLLSTLKAEVSDDFFEELKGHVTE